MCFDILHFFDGGLWGRHMWPELVRCIRDVSGGENITVIDDRYASRRTLCRISYLTLFNL